MSPRIYGLGFAAVALVAVGLNALAIFSLLPSAASRPEPGKADGRLPPLS